jgi:hypothetical protein
VVQRCAGEHAAAVRCSCRGQVSLTHTAGSAACGSEWLSGGRWLTGDSTAVAQQGSSRSWARKSRWLSSMGLPCRWAEVSGRQIDLQIGDICDWEFLSQTFTVSCLGCM